MPASPITFGPFRLDLDQRRLLRGDAPIALRRKAWEVLRHLCERPDTIVTTDELLDAVWPGIAVTPQTVTNVVREIRLALADRAGTPRWIQTVRGRGMVFRSTTDGETTVAPILVGRELEQRRLAASVSRAFRDTSRVVLVTGEPGIGKTTLVEAVVTTLPDGVRRAQGVCLEQHGHPESFLPLLSAFEGMAVGPGHREVVALLRQTAPTWLMRLPTLLRPDERLRIERSLVGATATRMLREGLAALRALAGLGPLVVLVEDLHWADPLTLDLLAALARAPGRMPLCVIATFRRADAAMRSHPVAALADELLGEIRATELALGPLDRAGVAEYVRVRLGGGGAPAGLDARLESLSAGNPLFLRALVDELLEAGNGAAGQSYTDHLLAELPDSLRAFVASETARLPHRLRRILEAASVIGDHALVPELATALTRSPRAIADDCERLASIGRLFRRAGEAVWHDGSSVCRYAFPHAAHRRIVQNGLAAHERGALHRRLAEGLATAYGPATPTIAARLAAHCEHGGLGARAVDYHELAATTAEARCAYAEAAHHLAAARARLDAAAGPGGDQSPRVGLLSVRLGEILVLAHGYSQQAVEDTYARALTVFERAAIPSGIFMAEMGLAVVDMTRARHRAAYERTNRLAALAAAGAPTLRAIASCWAGFASSALGELERARNELEAGVTAGGDPEVPRNFSIPRMLRSQLALVHTVRGDLEAAARCAADAHALSRQHGGVSELAHTALLAAERAVFLRDAESADGIADAIALAEGNGLLSYLALLRAYEAALRPGWPPERRAATLRTVLADRDRLGDRWHTALLLGLLAEAGLAAGDVTGAHDAVDAAFAHVAGTGERYYEAELCRLRAECTLASGGSAATTEAAGWLARAVETARRQGASLWEARALDRQARLSTAP